MRRILTSALALGLLAGGCGGDDDPNGDCDFEITAGDGAQPVYTFTDGNASRLAVVRVDMPMDAVWAVSTVPNDELVSPITHGFVPMGALETATDERNLATGVMYRLLVDKASGAHCELDFEI